MTNKLIHTVIEECVRQYPAHTAVEGYGLSLTYSELNRHANRLAHALLALGVSAETPVGVYAAGGPPTVICLLATFKAATVYVPMSPDLAVNRLEQMISETGMNIIITTAEHQPSLEQLLQGKDLQIVVIDNDINISIYQQNGPDTTSLRETNPNLTFADDSRAYIFYTSGSTGNSKGIIGSHTALSHYIHWHKKEWAVDNSFRISQLAPMTFDASLKDILTALASGATVCMPESSIKNNPARLVEWLQSNNITLLQTVPSVFRLITSSLLDNPLSLPALRYIVLAGERLYGRDVTMWKEANGTTARLSNLYGLTETTILKTYYHIPHWDWAPGEIIPVGFPISNTLVAVINNDSLCLNGEMGEVYIKSPFISKGYLNTSLNEQFLVQNPLEKDSQDLIWRTGDLGRYRTDNSLEILGRRDEQIKINGVRIELEQVRKAILQQEGITRTELLVHTGEDFRQELICYYTGTRYTAGQIRQFLSDDLNPAMLPSYYVWMDAFPLNMNGKVDRKALPKPEEIRLQAGYNAPHAGIEQHVALLWQQVLKIDRIGRDDNFFNVGGSSLKAIQMIAKIYRELDVQLTIAQLFANPLLTQLAELISRTKRDAYRPIPKVDEQETYPLSNSQKRVWVLSQLEGQSVAYNISSLYKIDGVLNIPALTESFSRLAERHESIRTVFILDEDEPRQRVLPVDESKTGLVIHDFRTAKSAAYAHAEAIAQQAFDLEQGPLFRVELLQLSNEEYLLVCSIHHIISDEWSMQVMVKEVIGMYNALTTNTATGLPALPIQYRDYAVWQQELLKEQSAHRQYWLSKFAGELPVLDLPADRRRPPVMQHRGSKVRSQFAAAQSTAFQQLLQKQQSTPFIGAIALVNLLLFRYTGQSDIIVGTPVAGREHPDLEDQIGYYLNTLVLRNEIRAEESFVQVLEHIRHSTIEAFSHQVYPFDLLVEELNLRRDLSRSPLFDVMVVWQTSNQDSNPELSFTGVQTERLLMKDTISKFDLTFFFEQDIHGLQLQIEYNTDLYDRERIESMISHLQGLLEVLLQQPDTAVVSLDYLPAREKELVLHTFNDTQANWHLDNMNLVSCFEQQVALHPGKTALISDNTPLSYKELNSRANQLADWLLTTQGAGSNELIGISTHRNEYLAIGILGILKAGAAYVPIDPAYPADRVEYIINDSQLRLLLNDEQLQELFTSENDYTKDNNPIVPQPSDLAYVIYTSGSTGNPKGVMIRHSAAINYIYWANDYYFQKDHSYTFPVFTSISFDLTITSLLTGFYRGDSVRLYAQTDLVACLETMLSQRTFNSLKITPAHIEVLNAIEGDLHQLEVIIVGGEELTTAHVEALKSKTGKDVKIFNEYGPTEATVGCVVAPVTDVTKAHLIGKPIANTQIYILDEYLQPQPVGIPGELCIAGDSVAQGYLNNDALTNEKFVTNNYGSGKLYRTGDIARWNRDGNIEFFGRKDNQVKIRGYRIELGEIEGCLLASGLVTQAVVVVVKNGEEKSLAAYYTPDAVAANLREYLQSKLPHYMVPAYFMGLKTLPLTSNGKIDRNALPVPHAQLRTYKPPVTTTEKALAHIWEVVLNNKKISLDDNFFEIGGHSLKAIQVIYRISKELSVKLELRDVFAHPVLSDLSALIEETKREAYHPIPKVAEQETYALSSSQRRLWVLSQIEEQSVAYNIPTLYKIRGALNTTALAKAFQLLVERHESMRTVFILKDGEPRQRVLPAGTGLVIRDFRNKPSDAQIYAQQIAQQVFNLEEGPLFKVELLQIADEEYLLVCSIHHIIYDEWSMQVMVKEVIEMYNAISGKQEPILPPLPIQYRDFAAWQQELSIEQHRQYWLSKFSDEIPVLELPADYSRPAVQQHHGSQLRFRFSAEQSAAFQQLLQQLQVTQFMGAMALINVLLFRYSGQSDLIIGTPVAGREHPDLENQIGYYLNTLALRNNINSQDSFIQVLQHIRQTTVEAFSHQAYPFDLLVEELDLRRDLSRSPLFDVMVVSHSNHHDNADNLSLAGVETERLLFKDTISKFDLTFFFEQGAREMLLNIEYNTDLYSSERIGNMGHHLQRLLDAIIKQPAQDIGSLSYLSPEEQEKVLHTFNNTQVNSNFNNINLVSCFGHQVALQPERTALVCKGISFSYTELNNRANQVANWLKTVHGVNSNELIGISTARNEHLVIGILGILKAGAAYVPIDPDYPADRINYIINDSKIRLLLTDKISNLHIPDLQILSVNDETLLAGQAECNIIVPHPSDIAYVIYTSGSTGNPKGVMIQHSSAVNVLASVSDKLSITKDDRWVAITTYTFDMSVVELLLPLITGSRLILATSNIPEELTTLINDSEATILQATPGMWNLLIQSGWKGSSKLQVISGGEVMSEGLIKQLLNLTARVWNMYGPTETTVFSTAIEITSPEQINLIGKPIANTQTYILDDKLQPQPIGIPGELCIAGEGVALGYLNKDSLTKEKFIENPYGKGKLYRTGDIARWNSNGNIEFFGRKDNQLKIRGYRIEPGEIEQCLLTSGLVNQVLITVDEEKSLVAYYTSDTQPETLKEYLQGKLPHYMIPAYFIQLESIPLTSNGKIDRKSLPVPHIKPRSYKPAVTLTELAVARIWEEVLNKPVSLDDNFFDIGGHSLKAIQVISRIFKELSVKLEFRDLFTYPVLSQLSALISRAIRETYLPIPRISEQETYPLSNSQKRLWVLSQIEAQSVAYNISTLYKLKGALDITALAASIRQLVERHEIMRTVFVVTDGEPRQRILSASQSGVELIFRDFRNTEGAQAHAERIAQLPFDLEQGPLFRMELLQVAEEEYLLVCSIHHIISDEWSMQIMVKELIGMYNGEEQPAPLPIQYRDYAVWQQETSGSHRQYWLSKFSGELPVLELPADYPRPAMQQHRGSQVRCRFSIEQSAAFRQLLQQQQATQFMGAMALVNILLFRYSGQSDLIIGTPVAGRQHPDLEDQIGYYLNTLPLRTEINGENNFIQVLEHIRQTTVEAFSRQVYPFDLLVEELDLKRDLSRSPLFDVMVVLQNANQDNDLSLNGIETELLGLQDTISKFDLTFYFEQNDLRIEYNTDLFSRERIEDMARHLQGLLDAILLQPATAVASLSYLTASEQDQVLNTFNNTGADWQLNSMDLVSCFEQQVVLYPDQTALISNGTSLSYRELNEKANQLADCLRTNHQVNSNELIGISTGRNEHLLIGILGILKAGAAYVPIDPEYPADRISYIIRDSKLRLVLSDQDVDSHTFYTQVLTINNLAGYATHNTGVPMPSDIAYVIYTSGSTGKPKGVMVQHHSAVNVLASVGNKLGINNNDRWVAITTCTFDMSVVELLLPLTTGSRLILAASNVPGELTTLINDNDATILQATPGMWNLLVYSGWKGSKKLQVISGGEAMSEDLAKQLLNLTGRVWNMYGPTETTVFSTAIEITSPEQINLIGKPIANTQIYILDDTLQLQPVGIPGELCIAGEGVAQGYLNKDSKDKFITNPYGEGKLYRTGDIARWNNDGNIVFFGRKDNQVKIRGYRIEPGEIEQNLLASGEVNQVIVLPVTIDTEKTLVAYYTSDAQPKTLREYLQGKLPHYMVPAYFMQLDKLPLTSNGKIDRNALPVPHIQPRNYKPAATATEKNIARIWEEILKKEVSIDDNFFDIGGHSLKAIQVISRIYQELQFKISFSTFMQNPTISDLAELFSRPDTKSAIIMELGTIETGKPDLFLFSPLIGTPVIYKKLCDTLSTQYNCYGLQDAGFDDADKADKSLSDKVDLFTKNILQKTTEKKISLLGFSFGATVAFEVAKQLEQKGMEISLIIIDRPVNKRRSLFNVRKNFVEQEDLNWFLDRIKTIDPGINVNWNNNIRLMENYKQKGRIHGQMIAFKSKDNLNKDFLTMEEWKEYTSGNFSHYYFKGDHYACLEMQDNIDRMHDILTQKDKIKEVNY